MAITIFTPFRLSAHTFPESGECHGSIAVESSGFLFACRATGRRALHGFSGVLLAINAVFFFCQYLAT